MLKKQDCGCDQHLAGVADDNQHDKQAPQDGPLEYDISSVYVLAAISPGNTRCFSTYLTSLADGWELSHLRPPCAKAA